MTTVDHPTLFTPRMPAHQSALKKLRSDVSVRVIDTYEQQLAELYVIENPAVIGLPPAELAARIATYVARSTRRATLEQQGTWAWLPWQRALVHILPEREFFLVRTNRNGNLITPKEQQQFYRCVVGVAGLSVGGSIALTLALQGGARTIRIADFDSLELSNTNRILAGVHELATPKTTIVARRIWEMNPYAHITIFQDGLTEKNIPSFMRGLDVVVDEMDQMAIKQLIREQARANKVALVSTADNGDTSVVDVERHDLKKTPYFLGRLGATSVERFHSMNKLQIIREITRLMGPENVPPRMQSSLPEIGNTLVSVPQLGGTALMGAAATAYCVHRIAAGLPLPSGRSIISLDEKLEHGHASGAAKNRRAKNTRTFAKNLGL
ncbi:MAG: ThiF family adenylyltransferase [Candidatus Pacebacteria bacterium]|nr:ThiF family adenylyltransferase [Candidatus Paceibacterota bacterium]